MFVDVHVLQSVPPSNLNRDDTGSPKSAVYGGVPRARVSSQAWKRAIRSTYQDPSKSGLNLGVRTKRAVELLVGRMQELRPELAVEDATARASLVLDALGMKLDTAKSKTRQKAADAGETEGPHFAATQYLVLWSNRQLDRLAELALASDGKPTKKAAAEAADAEHGIDVALFGRMVADAADLNVDAAVQVAHAISTHAVAPEQDYFTAVDDQRIEDETGAGMIGTIEFNSATLYRFATINVGALQANLGDAEATAVAIEAFVKGFVTSMPTGKQNTFANRTVPDAVVVCLRSDQPVNLVGAFEEAIGGSAGYLRESAQRLVNEMKAVADFGMGADRVLLSRSSERAESLDQVASDGGPKPLDALLADVGAAVRADLAPGAEGSETE